MPRSNRRCAVSLQEVAKWTVPRRWSVSSCASAGGVNDVAVTVTAMTDASLIPTVMKASLRPTPGQTCRTGYQDGVEPAIYTLGERELSLPARSATARLLQGSRA